MARATSAGRARGRRTRPRQGRFEEPAVEFDSCPNRGGIGPGRQSCRMRSPHRRYLLCALSAVFMAATPSRAQSPKTENVVLIVSDGLRWQEIFRGAERQLMSRSPGGVSDTSALIAKFWRDDLTARRAVLFPFLWGTVAREGQIFGNQDK